MERIKSFSVDHMTLLPGVYLSREDAIGPDSAFSPLYASDAEPHDSASEQVYPVSTFDVRVTRPNFEAVMTTAEIHAIEHLGATYLRNRADVKHRVIYWGPMGCRTGFYLILSGAPSIEDVRALMIDVFRFVADYEGEIPGATPVECGNYSDMDLATAKARATKYLTVLEAK